MGLYQDVKVRRFCKDGETVTINPVFGSDGRCSATIYGDLNEGRRELSDPEAIHEEVRSLQRNGWKELLID